MSDAAEPSRPVRFQVLGPIGLWGADGRELRPVLQQPKRLALFAYLALSGHAGYLRRDTVMGVFWPELDQEHARNALRQSLHFLRRWLGAGVIENRGDEEFGLVPGSVWCDAHAFETAIDAGRLEEALELYRSDLLPGFFVSEAAGFERWAELERDRLRARAVGAAWELADRAAAEGTGPALTWARRAVALLPEDESAIQRLLRLLHRVGDRSGALRVYGAFARRFEAEYGMQPSAETRLLVDEIRQAPDTDPPGLPSANEQAAATSHRAEPERFASGARGPDADVAAAPAGRWSTGPRILRSRILALSVLGVVVVWAALRFVHGRGGRPGAERDAVVIAPFEVLDARFTVWGEGLMRILASNLDGAGPLRTVSPTVALSRWDGAFDRESALRLARATGAAIAVTGHLLGAGEDSVRIVAQVFDAARDEPIGVVEAVGASDRMDRLSDSLTVSLLREIGRTRAIGAVRFTGIGSRSLPALRAYLRGEQYYRRTQWDSAIAAYRQAVDLDSTFAPALRRIGNVLGWQGTAGSPEAREYHARAGRFNRGLAFRDSLLVLADSLGAALFGFDNDLAWWALARRQAATLEEASRRYPDDPEIWDMVGEAGFHFRTRIGISIERVRAAFDRAILLDSSFSPAYLHPVNLAMARGDTAGALRYARAYLRRAHDDVTVRGLRLFVRVLERRRYSAADSSEFSATPDPAALFEAWVPLIEFTDATESGIRLAHWLATQTWLAPMPFADAAFGRRLYARSLAFRGRLGEARRVSGVSDSTLYAELAWLGAAPEGEARREFARWRDQDRDAARAALPWWADRGDTAAIAAFISRRTRMRDEPTESDDSGDRAGRRGRAGFDVAAGRAWLALAAGDTGAALDRFSSLPDSLCPDFYAHRIERARLLLHAGRNVEARTLLERELTVIVGGPRPVEPIWRLLRAEADIRSGDSIAGRAGITNVLGLWQADSVLAPFLDAARRLSGRG